MPLKDAAVTADVIFPVVVSIFLAECNARIVWLLFDVVAIARCDVVRQEPLGRHHCIWVILLPHGEVVCQLDLESLVPAVVCH